MQISHKSGNWTKLSWKIGNAKSFTITFQKDCTIRGESDRAGTERNPIGIWKYKRMPSKNWWTKLAKINASAQYLQNPTFVMNLSKYWLPARSLSPRIVQPLFDINFNWFTFPSLEWGIRKTPEHMESIHNPHCILWILMPKSRICKKRNAFLEKWRPSTVKKRLHDTGWERSGPLPAPRTGSPATSWASVG